MFVTIHQSAKASYNVVMNIKKGKRILSMMLALLVAVCSIGIEAGAAITQSNMVGYVDFEIVSSETSGGEELTMGDSVELSGGRIIKEDETILENV